LVELYIVPWAHMTRYYYPVSILIDSAVFTWLTNVTNQQTDTQTDHAAAFVAVGYNAA